MESWADRADAVYKLAMEMAERLREIHPNHELLELLSSREAVIRRVMYNRISWHTWPISQVLVVAYAEYCLDLWEVVAELQKVKKKDEGVLF